MATKCHFETCGGKKAERLLRNREEFDKIPFTPDIAITNPLPHNGIGRAPPLRIRRCAVGRGGVATCRHDAKLRQTQSIFAPAFEVSITDWSHQNKRNKENNSSPDGNYFDAESKSGKSAAELVTIA